MAFFDAPTFNPQGYGGQGGNLLDFLRSLQQQQQYQPSAGFPQTEQPQAQPIAVGNYMMPRTGEASLYEPQQAALPPNAQPTQGQLPQQQPAEPNRLMTGLQGFARSLVASARLQRGNEPIPVALPKAKPTRPRRRLSPRASTRRWQRRSRATPTC